MATVRLLSYNIRSMRDDRVALARVIRGQRPDVVCVQEAPRFFGWRRKRRWLARRAALAPAVSRRPAGLEVYAGPRARTLHREHHLLSPVPKMHRRGLAVGVFEVGGARLIAASVHLDLADAPRLTHAEEILSTLDRVRQEYDAPVVIAGDINEQPGGDTWNLLSAKLQDAYATAPAGGELTFSAANPRRRIDGVFADPAIEVLSCGVPDDPGNVFAQASDHRPLLAELAMRDASATEV